MLVITDTPIIEKTYLPNIGTLNIPEKLKRYLYLQRDLKLAQIKGIKEEIDSIQNNIDNIDNDILPTSYMAVKDFNPSLWDKDQFYISDGYSLKTMYQNEVQFDGRGTLELPMKRVTDTYNGFTIAINPFKNISVKLPKAGVYTFCAMMKCTSDFDPAQSNYRDENNNNFPVIGGAKNNSSTIYLNNQQKFIANEWQIVYTTVQVDNTYYLLVTDMICIPGMAYFLHPQLTMDDRFYLAWYGVCEGEKPMPFFYEGSPSGEDVKPIADLLTEYAPIIDKINDPQTYTFSTVGVLDNIYIGVTSYQMPLSFIDGTTMATIHAEGDFTEQLLQVEGETGDLVVYIYDNYNVGYNYSGQYRLTNVAFLNGETTAVLNFIGNAGATFFGAKYFPATTYSQVVYKYRNQITFDVYEYTQLGVGFVDKLITTVVQEMPTNGINYINLSEIALPYVQQTGGRMIRIAVTEKDFFGNTDTVQGRPLTFIYGSLPEVNYYKYILFNPVNGGAILPTTVDKIYFNEERIYPFYINFILQDEGIPENGATAKILFKTYVYEGEEAIIQDEVQDLITVSRGLNSVNIANVLGLLAAINKSHDYMTVQIGYETGYATGQFTEQFTEEFVLSGSAAESLSNPFTTRIERRTLNDRRDFYLQYNSGIGGLSAILSTNYEESIEPEIVSLRNREVLNNTVVRSTEIMNVTFDQANLDKLKELLGFEPSYMFKVNGIYESSSLTRIGADLSEKEYIIRNATYNKSNQELYNTVNVELFRPMNAGFQQIGSVEINTSIVTEGVTAGMIQIVLELTKIENLLITSYGFTTQDGDDYNTYEFKDDNYFVRQEVAVKAQANNMIIQSFARTSQGIRYGKQIIYKG